MSGRRLLYIPLAIVLALVYLPLFSVVLFSFKQGSAPIMPIDHLTTNWYSVLFKDSQLQAALWTTLKVGVITVVIVLAIATAAAFGLRGRRFPGRGVYEAIIALPFLLPEVVVGVALLTLFNSLKVNPSIQTIVVGHVIFCLGAGFRIVAARVESLPRSIDEAAHDLGRGTLGAFWFVLLPGVRSALVTAGLLVFALSFDQTVITIFVSGTTNTLPTLLWAKLRLDTTPEVNALASLMLLTSFLVAIPLALRANKDLVH